MDMDYLKLIMFVVVVVVVEYHVRQ